MLFSLVIRTTSYKADALVASVGVVHGAARIARESLPKYKAYVDVFILNRSGGSIDQVS